MDAEGLTGWLARRWVTGAAFMAGALLAVFPMIAARYVLLVQLIYLCSPAYMVHQVEEHSGDRFRTFVNSRLFAGNTAMTTFDVLVINIPLVWGVNLLSALAACFIAPSYGLLAGYAMLINGVGHIAWATKMRSYNPGLITAVILFLPLGLSVVLSTGYLGSPSLKQELLAFGLAVGFHLLIAGNAIRRAAAAKKGVMVRSLIRPD